MSPLYALSSQFFYSACNMFLIDFPLPLHPILMTIHIQIQMANAG